MVDWGRVGSLDDFDLDSVMDREERIAGGFIARKGPLAVIVFVVVAVFLSIAFMIPISSVSRTASSGLTGWTKNIVDITPGVVILGFVTLVVIILVYMKYSGSYADGYEGGAVL